MFFARWVARRNAKLVYNNSPSFNWTLNFRQQAYDAMKAAGKDVSAYGRTQLMSVEYDQTELAAPADEKIRISSIRERDHAAASRGNRVPDTAQPPSAEPQGHGP